MIPLALMVVIPWPALVYLAMSLLTFALYWMDKSRAGRGRWRISETMLHLAEILCGWPGALIAQQTLGHKNRKPAYQVIFWLIVASHVGFWAWRWGYVRF